MYILLVRSQLVLYCLSILINIQDFIYTVLCNFILYIVLIPNIPLHKVANWQSIHRQINNLKEFILSNIKNFHIQYFNYILKVT